MINCLSAVIFGLKTQRKLFYAVFLLWMLLLSGCSSLHLGQLFQPVNMDKLSTYDQTRLNCSMQTGLMSESDFAFISSGIVSVGLRLPSSADMDFNYDRRLDEYHDCLRISGL